MWKHYFISRKLFCRFPSIYLARHRTHSAAINKFKKIRNLSKFCVARSSKHIRSRYFSHVYKTEICKAKRELSSPTSNLNLLKPPEVKGERNLEHENDDVGWLQNSFFCLKFSPFKESVKIKIFST